MAWIESHQALGGHPKTLRLARLLGVSLPQTVGHLQYLWWWAVDYAPKGDLQIYDEQDLADAAKWDGNATEFVAAMLSCGLGGGWGFLERTDGGLIIHDWMDYAGRLIARREANAKRMNKTRATHVQCTGKTQDTHTATCAGPPTNRPTVDQPLPTVTNLDISSSSRSLTREGETTTTTTTATPIEEYENEVRRPVTVLEAEALTELINAYGSEQVSEAIREAVACGKWHGGPKYLAAILNRWKTEGKRGNGVDKGNTQAGSTGGAKPDRYTFEHQLLAQRAADDAKWDAEHPVEAAEREAKLAAMLAAEYPSKRGPGAA